MPRKFENGQYKITIETLPLNGCEAKKLTKIYRKILDVSEM